MSSHKPDSDTTHRFKFKEGDQVAIKERPQVVGTIWCLYDCPDVPAYEVTFCDPRGEYDALMYEDELMKPIVSTGVQ